MSDTICIYHGKCADGFTAAWAVYKALGPDVEYYAATYGEEPPDVKGKHVIMVDFSYKRPVLEKISAQAQTLVVLDHHKTAADDLKGFPPPGSSYDQQSLLDYHWASGGFHPIFSTFDMERSGAGIAWDYFHPGKPRPLLVDYVEDRDLWRFNLPHSRAVNAFIFSRDYTWKEWNLVSSDIDIYIARVVHAGEAIERKHHKDVKELVEVCRRRMVIADTEVWGASIPYTMTSDAGNLMAQGELFAACYWDTPKGRVFSLRSTPDGTDVSEIAKAYGGGGHRNAAGFTVPLSEIGQFEL